MPFNLPSYVQQVRLPGPSDQSRANPEAAGIVGATLAHSGEQITAYADRWKQQQDIAAASEVVANTAGELGRRFYEQQAQAPEGAHGFADGFRTSATELLTQATAGLSPQAAQFARNRLLGHVASWVDSAWRYEASARREWQVRTTGRAMDTFAANVRSDPASLDQTLADASAAIDGSGLGPRDRTILAETTRSRLAFEAIQGLAQSDPAAARALLQGPSGQLLDERHRAAAERLIQGGQGRRVRDAQIGDAEANRVRIASEEGAQLSIIAQRNRFGEQGFGLLNNGQLTTTWVESNRHVLSPSDYRVFRRATDPGAVATSDNPSAVHDLTDAIDSGDPEAFAAVASREVDNGRLTPQTYARMVKRNREASQLNAAAGVALRSVRDHLRPRMDGPMNSIIREVQTEAVGETLDWHQQHPQATPQEVQDATTTIIQNSRARAWQRIAPALPALQGYGGTPDQIELTDIDRMERQAVQQMDRQEITPTQALGRLRTLRQWRYAIPLRPATGRSQ